MPQEVTLRFIECHQALKEKGTIRTNSEFAEALDYSPQTISEILNGRRDITIKLMQNAVEQYRLNPVYLTTGKGPMFLNDTNPSGLQVLSIVLDEKKKERIVHVPVNAQAGYAEELSDPTYLSELPTYSLPDHDFSQGTYRSFDVEGQSMYPTLNSGDRVICQFVEPNMWTYSIKENKVYVVVTTEGVIVKRIKNKIQQYQKLIICSDNKSFPEYPQDIRQVKEVWKVKYVLKRFDDFRPASHSQDKQIEDIKQMLNSQYSKITKLINEHKNKDNPIEKLY